MKFIVLAACVAALAGCATTQGTEAITTVSGFDNARVVDVAAHGNACKSLRCTGIGGQWNSKTPESVILTVYVFNEIKGITGASLSINGKVTRLDPLPGLTNFSRPGSALRESRKDFAVPLSVVREITTANNAWLRVFTTEGYVEDQITDGKENSKAHYGLVRLLAAVDQPKK